MNEILNTIVIIVGYYFLYKILEKRLWGGRMKVKDLIMKLIYCNPEAVVKCVTYKNANEDADEFALNIRTLEDYEDNVDLVLDNLDVGRFNEDQVFEILRNKVLDWAKDKDLLHADIAEKQFLKFMEEVFEFRDEWILCKYAINDQILSKQMAKMKLEMGDIFVTLIILCDQLNLDPVECLYEAYEKIKDRKGKTINGVFIKEEDLRGDLKWQTYKNKKIEVLVQ